MSHRISKPDMRLLIVTNDFPPKPGGIQMYLKNLVDAYPDAVHAIWLGPPARKMKMQAFARGV